MITNGSDILAFIEEGGVVLHAKEVSPAFFDLKSGLAGDVLQKAVNYRIKLAVVLDGRLLSERFQELVFEHQRHPNVRFFENAAEATAWARPA